MLLLVPIATALELAQPQMLLPACCRTHGAHHCSMLAARRASGLGWQAPGCPFAHLQHAAVVLPTYLPTAPPFIHQRTITAAAPSSQLAVLASFLAALPASRAPPAAL